MDRNCIYMVNINWQRGVLTLKGMASAPFDIPVMDRQALDAVTPEWLRVNPGCRRLHARALN